MGIPIKFVTIAEDRPRTCTAPTITRPVRSAPTGWRCCAWLVRKPTRKYLSAHYSEAELDRQLMRMRRLAHRLVSDARPEIKIVARALLRYGTLDKDRIAELGRLLGVAAGSLRRRAGSPWGGLAHAQGLDHCQPAIEDTIKDISRTLSGYADINFHPDAVHLTPSFHRRLRQHTGLFDERCNRRRQLGDSRDCARPILNRKPLRQGVSGYESKQRYQKTHDGYRGM